MKKVIAICVCSFLICLFIGSALARDALTPGVRTARALSADERTNLIDPGLRGLYESAAVDTYYIVWYNFEQMNWQGWTRVDNTVQKGTFFHVDDFAGLNGGVRGNLIPLEGTKSTWCGARPNPFDPYMCTWIAAPGYGSYWNQYLTSPAFSFVGAISWSYKCFWDSEDGWDITHVEYDAGNSSWQIVDEWTGRGDSIVTTLLALPQASTKLRYRLSSDSNTNDEDGLLNTDGAFIVDSITVRDNTGVIHFANFEAQAVGALTDGWWTAAPAPGYGTFAGLKTNLADKDPCGDNFGTQVVFFIGSPYPSASYPGLYDTPFCTGPGNKKAPCQDEMIISPVIDMHKYSTAKNNVQDATIPVGDLPALGGTMLYFNVYCDLPFENCVYYVWQVRKLDPITGCPTVWRDDNLVYCGPERAYIHASQNVSCYIATNDDVQIGFGVIDMCEYWGTTTCTCIAHTPSPWFDQIRLLRFKTQGPQWSYRDTDLFQDNFPSDENNIESYIRVDAANDINPSDNPVVRLGDSVVVRCTSTMCGGIAHDVDGGPAVYMHAKCLYVGCDSTPKPPYIDGVQLQGTYGTWKSVDADHWNVFRCDSARSSYRNLPAPDAYCIDLNDSLFTRGYEIDYYFTAKDNCGIESRLLPSSSTGYAEKRSSSGSNEKGGWPENCFAWGGISIPLGGGGAISFWGGAKCPAGPDEGCFSNTWKSVSPSPIDNLHLRGNINVTDLGVKDWFLARYYDTILWHIPELSSLILAKGDDCDLILNALIHSEHSISCLIFGHNAASAIQLKQRSWPGAQRLEDKFGFRSIGNSFFNFTGGITSNGITSPLLTGSSDANIFNHAGVPDKFFLDGSCSPSMTSFDVLEKTGLGKYAFLYPTYAGQNYGAGIATETTNDAGYPLRLMLLPFGFESIRDDRLYAPIDRFEVLRDILLWMYHNVKPDVSPAELPKVNKLAQNFPNPFNPSTSIKFDMKDKGLVRLRIYNVAGQLVRTLLDDVKDAGCYSIAWDGKNNRDAKVGSGIYFYKMETKGFSATKKMVVLK